MRVLITAVGTRGDVQPALVLARGLLARGHGVRMCTSPAFVETARELGVDARSMGVDMRPPTRPPSPEELQALRAFDHIGDQFATVEAAVAGCDVVLGANAHQYAAPSVAEAAGIPCVTAVYAPVFELWRSTRDAWNARALERVCANRARLGLAAIDDVLDNALGDPVWLAADPVLAPPVEPGVVALGAWFEGTPGALPEEVEAFLGAGERPVYVGFGSMPVPPGMAVALDAALAGRRAIVARGWGGLELAGADRLVVDAVDHDALFPRVAAVVHHGGAGTTHTAARAGVPQLVVPMFSDQPYWADRVAALGAGVRAGSDLADGLERALACAGGARALAGRLGPSGVQATVDALEALV